MIGLIVNARAGAVRRRYLQRTPFWRSTIPEALVHITTNLTELDAAIADLRARDVGVVALLGGDGTLHHGVDALLRHYTPSATPIVLALGGGTMNGVARALGSRGRPEEVLRHALADPRTDTPRLRVQPVLRISDSDARHTRYGFSFATGLVYGALEHYYRSRAPRLAAAISASLWPRGFNGERLDVHVDGGDWLAKPHTMVASVLEQPLLWFRPFGSPVGDHDTFNLAATSLSPLAMVPRLWTIFRGRCRHPQLRVSRARDASIEGASIGYLIDGELYPCSSGIHVQITVGPALRFLAASA